MASDASSGVDFRAQVAELVRRAPKGTRVYAVLPDGSDVQLDAPPTRDRASRIARVADARGAARVEIRLDDCVVDCCVRDLPILEVPKESDSTTEVERLLSLVIRAQESAVERHASMMRAVLDAAVRVMQVSAARTERIERALERALVERERAVEHAIAELASSESEKADSITDDLAKQVLSFAAAKALGGAGNTS